MTIAHIILIVIVSLIILYHIAWGIGALLTKYADHTNSFSYTPYFNGFFFVVWIILLILAVVFVDVESTTSKPKVSYNTTVNKQSILDFPKMEKIIRTYFQDKQDQQERITKKYAKTYYINKWKGQPLQKNQSVKVIGGSSLRGNLFLELADGSRGYSNDVQLPYAQRDASLDCELTSEPCCLMSRKHFDTLIKNKTIDQIDPDKRYRTEVANVHGEWFALMAFKVFDEDSGIFFHPVLICDQNKRVVQYRKLELKTHANAWILKRMPFASWIYDQPWLTWLADKNLYDRFDERLFEESNIFTFILTALVAICILIIRGIQVAFLCCVPMLLLMLLMHFRYAYPLFNNKVLPWVLGIIGFMFAHCISVIALSYITWVIYLPLSVLGFVLTIVLMKDLIFDRCTNCHLMFSKERIRTDITSEYDTDYYGVSEAREVVGRRTHYNTKKVTETTTLKNQYGHTVYEDSDTTTTTTSKTFETRRYDDYKQKDHVKELEYTWLCDHCMDVSHSQEIERKVVDRVKIGSHLETKQVY